MNVPEICTLYENSGNFFRTYQQAYFNGKITGNKKVWYVFTPTMKKSKNVTEHENTSREFFTKLYKSNIYDYENNISANQLSLLERKTNEQ